MLGSDSDFSFLKIAYFGPLYYHEPSIIFDCMYKLLVKITIEWQKIYLTSMNLSQHEHFE